MKCLVTGATGFIGRSLCRSLKGRGDELVAINRSGAPVTDTIPGIACDLAVDDVDASYLEGVDVVYHLAGIAHQSAPESAYAALNYGATVRLARRARESGVRKFVFLSSVKAMGPPTGREVRAENDCNAPVGPYARSKREAEEALLQEYATGPMAVLIVRPALVYGPGVKGNLRQLAIAVQRRLPRPPEGGRRSMIALADLTDLLCHIPGHAPAGNHTWIACGAGSYSTRDVYDLMRAALGWGRGSAWLARPAWWLGAAVMDLRSPGRGESTYSKLFGAELYANQRVVTDTGWRPSVRLEDSIAPLLAGARS
ncbi:MAG: NAD-dependent epimerase/dehydratase family protein [Halioglobus sp.]|nr:NAD-dependent epimerase/dehydratase family protein [Halioglobus sp.]